MTDAELFERASAWRQAGLGAALATVVQTWGSAPRQAGSHLVVGGQGEFLGSVSGGCVEGAVVSEALAVLRGGAPRLLEFGVTNERAWEVGLACGGTVQVWVGPLPAEAELAALLADLTGKRPVVVATDLETGAAVRLHPFAEEAGAVDPALLAAARKAAEADRSVTWPGPAGTMFLRVYLPPARLLIVGAVHVAQALAPMARLAGLDVTVVDPRTAFASEARFAGEELVREWPGPALERLRLDRRTAVVALSHDPKLDDPALLAALRSRAFYVGALGSKKTAAARRERLLAEGLDEAALARLHAPLGLAIGAVSPGEIAVSVLAELVASLRGREPQR